MESLKEQRKNRTLLTLATVKVATTEQIARLHFPENGSPAKRASEILKELQHEKYIEGKKMSNMQKVWRLSIKGRQHTEKTFSPVPLNTMKMNHYLGLTDIYVELQKTGKLKYFEIELRERFTHDHTDYVFAPDALFVWDKSIYLCELQYARLSQKQWGEKWRIYRYYFDYQYFKSASWQRFGKGKFLKPEIVVVSQQNPDIVVSQFDVEGRRPILVSSINEMWEVRH